MMKEIAGQNELQRECVNVQSPWPLFVFPAKNTEMMSCSAFCGCATSMFSASVMAESTESMEYLKASNSQL